MCSYWGGQPLNELVSVEVFLFCDSGFLALQDYFTHLEPSELSMWGQSERSSHCHQQAKLDFLIKV